MPSPPLMEQPPSRTDVLILSELNERCMGNLEFAERVVARFLSQLDADLIEIKQAASADDLELVTRIAHRTKGAAANVTARTIVEVAAEIESASRSGDAETLWYCLSNLQAEQDRLKRCLPLLDPTSATTV